MAVCFKVISTEYYVESHSIVNTHGTCETNVRRQDGIVLLFSHLPRQIEAVNIDIAQYTVSGYVHFVASRC